MSRFLLIVAIFAGAVVLADPARPQLHETFEAHSTAWLKRGSESLHGTGRWAVDQPHGMAVEHVRFDNGSEHHNVEVVQRYDQSTQYEVLMEGDVVKCHKTALSPPMHTVWSWVKEAVYKGVVTIRRQEVDFWEYNAGAGVTLGVGVNKSNADQPLWYVRKTSSESFELHFERYFHRQANATQFAVPKVCQTEDGWVTHEPVFESSPVENVPFTLQAVLNCASHICTCGCPYVWGGNGPCCPGKSGFDCSGLQQHCYSAGGWSIPRVAADQQKHGKACTGGLQAGDLLFFGNPAHHVVMYAGSNSIYECPHTGANCHHTALRAYDGGCRRIA
jgi:hypothetical protein